MRTRDAYNQWAETYDSDENRTGDLDQEVAQNTLSEPRCKSVLEIGCGTGKNTVLPSGIGETVHVLNFSDGMLRRAKDKIVSANVQFAIADLTAPWPYANRSLDLIVCNLVLEHITDLPFIFSQASRVLANAGRFFICELRPFRQYQGTQANFQHDTGSTVIPAFRHHISDFLTAAEASGFTLTQLKEWWLEL